MSSAKDAVFESFTKQYEQFGPIRLRRYNDLLGGEIEEYERQTREGARMMLELNEIARAIGANPESQMSAEEAFTLLSSNTVETAMKLSLVLKYGPAGGMGLLQSVMPAKEEQNTRLLTLLINSRGSARVGDDWLPLEGDWDDADTRKLPREVREGILQFIAREATGGESPEGKPGKGESGKKTAASTAE